MKRLKVLILFFCVAISIPLAYFVFRTFVSLEQDEMAELRYFSGTLFDEMERGLAVLVRHEENRAIDEYNYTYAPTPGAAEVQSPLSKLPSENYILGYFQNNPDGSFQTPLIEHASNQLSDVVGQLRTLNSIFNTKRTVSESLEIYPAESEAIQREELAKGIADRYLLSRQNERKQSLGQEKKRVEQITMEQALNVSQLDEKAYRISKQKAATPSPPAVDSEMKMEASEPTGRDWNEGLKDTESGEKEAQNGRTSVAALPSETLQVEVDPMQSVLLDDNRIFVFRRIVIHNQIYRQGFVILTEKFLNHLTETYFFGQPMSQFTHLSLRIKDQQSEVTISESGIPVKHARFSMERSFPRPFSFLKAKLTCEKIPRSEGRKTLNIMIGVLAVIMLIGLFSIYRSASSAIEMSERRTRFASSVTHELKTPLTNIRMYIEMLEQGIAPNPEREQEYFKILSSESARLSRLINNVLEFSKLEKKQLRINPKEGTFEDVIEEVQHVMREKLKQEGFKLNVDTGEIKPFRYDREIMIQVLINLIENSMKFGKKCPVREITLGVNQDDTWTHIRVSDTGPGIPKHALKKVFDDFYRVDNDVTRDTRGTGIGLAFVKKSVQTLGGRVVAENNDADGCTIRISLN